MLNVSQMTQTQFGFLCQTHNLSQCLKTKFKNQYGEALQMDIAA